MPIFEELQSESKTYPENHRTFKVPANAYMAALTQYISSRLTKKLSNLSQDDQFEDSIQLAQLIAELIEPDSETLSLPLRRVLFSTDSTLQLPLCDHFSLGASSLITNDKTAKTNFFKNLKFELQTSDNFTFMVSFIRSSGLQLLLNPLESFQQREKRGRILTSVYMNITQPAALRKLLEQSHIETRVYTNTKESFHTKAYLFERQTHNNSCALIGSSNLSQAALINGEEWNVKIPRSNTSDVYDRAMTRFETLWDSAESVPLTESFIEQYEAYLEGRPVEETKTKKTFDFLKQNTSSQSEKNALKLYPNQMQQEALVNLASTRSIGETRAVAIAATGTGKTFLAAFDAHQCKAKQVLFLAHRDELLEGAIETFAKVFGSRDICGKYTGTSKETDKRFIFSTVQTLSREKNLQLFAPDAFDYMVVDEFHHAQAETYQKVINYFTPAFLLGMTATPERMDGRDVLKLCHYNIVCDIRLKEALAMELLAPFHYFGVADETVDYDQIERQASGQFVEAKLVNRLNTAERVDYIIEQMNKYSFHGQRRCTLGFCVNRAHAEFMNQSFNARGIASTVLTGLTDTRVRQQEINNLQDSGHPLEVIFTVDIFNEGVDIPQVNFLLFLRPTESSTIFIQQLGRGLRKANGKEYVTVLDFIGNYQNSYMVPLALSGESGRRDFDKDTLKRAVTNEFADLPAGCYVELDEVAKEKIISKLDSIRLDKTEYLKQLYLQFKKDLGSSPELMDFYTAENAPNPNFFLSKFGSLYSTKTKCNDHEGNHPELNANRHLREVSERLEAMCPLKWPYEFIALHLVLVDNLNDITTHDIVQGLSHYFSQDVQVNQHHSLITSAMTSLASPHNKISWTFGSLSDNTFSIAPEFQSLMNSSEFARSYISERINYGLKLFRRHFKPDAFLGDGERFIRYQNYTRNDIQFLSGDTAKKGTWREGVKRVGKHYFLFINLNKDEEVDAHLHYKDYFIDPRTFHWQSQNQTSHSSSVGQHFIHHNRDGYQIHLFVRKQVKQYSLTLPFMYLGQVGYVSSKGDKPMSILWKLHSTVPLDIYEDLTE
ncbi:DUF3427 domain-containing protein [Endozoicomonas ascidiicola]|uniref:DUF3427 domain-containing protein n=1 Tax=Endozoicomonas ascidiicola TaxID=1698521 RepID=UPI000834D750|nr:DUF3427 domain-containing protein [Endozoicomonas ascidiicola]